MERIKNFVKTWKNHGYEKSETHSFWLSFLRDILNISEPEKILLAELPEKFSAFDFMVDANKNKIRIELELSLNAQGNIRF